MMPNPRIFRRMRGGCYPNPVLAEALFGVAIIRDHPVHDKALGGLYVFAKSKKCGCVHSRLLCFR